MSLLKAKLPSGEIVFAEQGEELRGKDLRTVGAHCDENGGIAGTSRGDQTGHEIDVGDVGSWHYVFRKG